MISPTPDPSPKAITWKETRARLREDRQRVKQHLVHKFGYCPLTYFLDPSYVAVLLYRVARYWWCRGNGKIAHVLTQINTIVTGADIHPASDIGPGLLLTSPHGTCISGVIGRNATFMAISGTGTDWKTKDIGAGPGLSVLGDDVFVAPYGCALGPVRVGDAVHVGPGAVVNADVPAGAVVERLFRSGEGVREQHSDLERPACARDHRRWANTKADLRGDIDRYLEQLLQQKPANRTFTKVLSALLTSQMVAIILYRVAHLLYLRRWTRLALALCWCNILINKTTIHPGSCIGPRMFLPHPSGFVFSGTAGCDVTFYGLCLCGAFDGALSAPVAAAPILGDRVTVSGHAGVFGPVTIGEGARVLLKVHISHDMQPHTLAFSPMTRATVKTPGEQH
jgi:serine O-acetyltransferase